MAFGKLIKVIIHEYDVIESITSNVFLRRVHYEHFIALTFG